MKAQLENSERIHSAYVHGLTLYTLIKSIVQRDKDFWILYLGGGGGEGGREGLGIINILQFHT